MEPEVYHYVVFFLVLKLTKQQIIEYMYIYDHDVISFPLVHNLMINKMMCLTLFLIVFYCPSN